MKIKFLLMSLIALITAVTLSMPEYAEAARMGGGRSFGSRPSMSQPAQRPMTTQRHTATTQAPGRSGMLGGMGGIFGGLLAGTLLGSLLSGNGFAGGGGGFMDLVFFGILAFIAYKIFQKFRNRQAPSAASAGNTGYFSSASQDNASNMYRTDAGADAWSRLKDKVYHSGSGGSSNASPDIPADFNEAEFLKGAKMAYTRLQASWDKRDLNDIAQFATGAVLATLQEQLAQEPNPSHTELLMVDAQLVGVEQDGPAERAQVYFDVLMKERPDQQTPENVREIWHFMRMGKNGSWKLDGIQQVQ